jgi:hypothetical protein
MHMLIPDAGLIDSGDIRDLLQHPELGDAETVSTNNDSNVFLIDRVFMIILDFVVDLRIFLEGAVRT